MATKSNDKDKTSKKTNTKANPIRNVNSKPELCVTLKLNEQENEPFEDFFPSNAPSGLE